jgi:CRISPR-associated protein Cmr1
MIQVTFTVRTLTPLFLAGADQNQAELRRSPAFRGLMRYWYRALVGGIVGTNTEGLKIVAEEEAKVFGATDRGSVVAVRVSQASQEPREFTEPISRRTATGWQATGKGYLLWTMAKSGRVEKNNLKPARWYFPPGTTFRVMLSAHSQDDTQFKQAIAAFWLLSSLGALGSRSRRCAGSIEVQAIDMTQANKFQMPDLPFQSAPSLREMQGQIEQGLQIAKHLLTQQVPSKQINEARFDVLAPGICRIWLLQEQQTWSSAEAAMHALGESLQEYRSHIPIYQRSIFGFPLPPKVFNKRRASPLLLRVSKLQGGQYVGIAVLFKTTDREVRFSDYEIIERWIKTFPVKLEVKL